MFALKFDAEKVSDGVEVAVATEVVNRGDRFPAEKFVTDPTPAATHDAVVPSVESTLPALPPCEGRIAARFAAFVRNADGRQSSPVVLSAKT